MFFVVAARRKQTLLEAKQKSTEQTTATLIQDEEEACFSEPDPVSTTGLATSLASRASVEELKEVTMQCFSARQPCIHASCAYVVCPCCYVYVFWCHGDLLDVCGSNMLLGHVVLLEG